MIDDYLRDAIEYMREEALAGYSVSLTPNEARAIVELIDRLSCGSNVDSIHVKQPEAV